MNTRLLFLFLLVTTLISSCDELLLSNTGESKSTVLVDIDNMSSSPLLYSNYIDSISYLTLHQSSDYRIGYVQNVRCFGGYYFILDVFDSKRLFVFDGNGQFINSIGEIGNGIGAFHELVDFSVDKKLEQLYLLDRTGKINVYSLTGNFVRSFNIQNKYDDYFNNIEITGASIFLDISYPQLYDTPRQSMLREVSFNGEILNDWLDLKEINKSSGKVPYSNFMQSLFDTPDGVFYGKEFMNVIYQIEENALRPVYVLESQDKFISKDIASMDPSVGAYLQAVEIEKIFNISRITIGNNFKYFFFNKGHTPYSLIEKDNEVTLHQEWIDDVSFPDLSFNAQPPPFFTTKPDNKTLVGLMPNKSDWYRGIEVLNLNKDAIITSFNQVLSDADGPVLILYHMK